MEESEDKLKKSFKTIGGIILKVAKAPVEFFASHRKAAYFWFAAFTASMTVFLFVMCHLRLAEKNRSSVVVMDEKGSYHIVPAVGTGQASKMIRHCAQLATVAALERESADLKNEELFGQLYRGSAVEYLKKYYEETRSEYERLGISQSVEIEKIQNETRGENIYAWVTGRLSRKGTGKDGEFNDSIQFEIVLHLIKNQNIKDNGGLPLVVKRCNLTTKKG